MEREPKLRLMLHSPAQQALDLAARAFPIVQPQPRVTDERPLMQATRANVALPPPPSRLPMLGAAAGLFTMAAFGLWAGKSDRCPALTPDTCDLTPSTGARS